MGQKTTTVPGAEKSLSISMGRRYAWISRGQSWPIQEKRAEQGKTCRPYEAASLGGGQRQWHVICHAG